MSPVWFAASHGDLGGGEVMTLNLARAARELGYDARVVAPSQPGRVVTQALAEGFRTAAIHGGSPLRLATNLAAWDISERRGLLWANGLRTAAATAGHRNRVVHLHQVPHGAQVPAARVAALGARAVVVPSQFAAAAVPHATLLSNWTHPFAAPSFDRRLVTGAGEGPVMIGFLGRVSALKGVTVLAQAVALLDARAPGRYRLLLAGEPTYAGAEDRESVAASLAPVGHLVKRAGRQRPGRFFAEVDLAVFPSVAPESFGLVVAEAMSVGCPFVISDAGALPEVAQDHPYVAAAGDPVALADAIERATAGYNGETLEAAYHRWLECFAPSAGREALGALLRGLGATP